MTHQKTTLSDILRNVFYIFLIIAIAPPIVQQIWGSFTRVAETRTKVAWVEIDDLVEDSGPYVSQLKKYFGDKEIKAILLKMESPGAVAGSAQALFNEIMHFKKEHPKPVITLVENTCASGGYWIACSADHIIASSVAKIGSIGVVIRAFTVKDLLDQYKIHYTPVTAGAYKTAGDPFTTMTEAQKKMLDEMTHQTYEQFTASIASRRPKLSLKDLNTWADGKIFIGAEALKLGLIDELGSISTAEAWLRKHASIEGKIEWVRMEGPSLWERFTGKAHSYYSSDTSMNEAMVEKIASKIMTQLSAHGFMFV